MTFGRAPVMFPYHSFIILYRSQDNKKRRLSSEVVSWNGAESSLYRVLRPIYQSNFCTIAKLIKTKSCQEVTAVL